ncbi:MAG: alanine racemase C-terminal domain-containing protein [Enterocloster clostridioformis]|nr:alanine racemase C-terminal domain-containing protein [Enterocloster clostridioformis]MDY5477119.1 alanine racemase C-terminal domain-containing protein [Enterocloster clostridioformis]
MPFSLAVVTLRGKQVPVIGVVCMDQCMIDLTGEYKTTDRRIIPRAGADS